eukprot:2115844-Ditylum_brightwellii.AAC.1
MPSLCQLPNRGVTWHIDNIKASHVDPKVNTQLFQWSEATYRSDLNRHVNVVQGKRHNYLGMILDFSKIGCLMIHMKYYILGMLDNFPYK